MFSTAVHDKLVLWWKWYKDYSSPARILKDLAVNGLYFHLQKLQPLHNVFLIEKVW